MEVNKISVGSESDLFFGGYDLDLVDSLDLNPDPVLLQPDPGPLQPDPGPLDFDQQQSWSLTGLKDPFK